MDNSKYFLLTSSAIAYTLLALAALVVMPLQGCKRAKPQDDIARFDEMKPLLQQQQYEELTQAAEKYLEEYPESVDGRMLLAWGYTWTDKTNKAEPLFREVLEIDPTRENAWVGLGVIHRTRGELDQAIECYEKSIDLKQDNPEAYNGLVIVHLKLRDYDKAIELGQKAWAMNNKDAIIAANLAIAYHCVGDRQRRDEFYDHAERLGYQSLDKLDDIINNERTFKEPATEDIPGSNNR